MSRREREERLDEVAREAAALRQSGSGGTVAGRGVRASGGPLPAPGGTAEPVGYYGLPVLKAPVWTWEVPLYFFVGGTAGAAAVLATAYDMFGQTPEVARRARHVALAGGLLSPLLLTSDLGRPERFLNMLRVFKWRSPMSMGSWILAVFGPSVTVSALAHELATLRIPPAPATDTTIRESVGHGHAYSRVRVGRPGREAAEAMGAVAGVAAALSGALLATYTGVLLAATAIPVWNQHRRLLPAHFGAAAIGSAASVLTLCGCDDEGLNALALAASAVECGVGAVLETSTGREHEPVRHGRSGHLLRLGGVLTGPVALGLRLLGARRAASWSFVAGALITRFGWIEAGGASAADSAALFEMQQRSSD
jgi:formate-dependent nitrite reductase membrane component NrfD